MLLSYKNAFNTAICLSVLLLRQPEEKNTRALELAVSKSEVETIW